MLPIKSGGEVLHSDPFQKAVIGTALICDMDIKPIITAVVLINRSVTYVQFRL